MKILITEDSEDLCILLQDILESEGYEVISAENGKHALDLSKEHEPNIIILN